MGSIVSIFRDEIREFINSQWTNIELWRWLAIILFVSIVLLWTFRKKVVKLLSKPHIREHDKEIFKQIEEILPESTLRDSVDYFANIHPVPSGFLSSLEKLHRFGRNIQNAFINKKLNSSFSSFLDKASRLRAFVGTHYWLMSNDWLKMYPDDHRDSERYIEASKAAPDIASDFIKSYCCFRKQIKQTLLI